MSFRKNYRTFSLFGLCIIGALNVNLYLLKCVPSTIERGKIKKWNNDQIIPLKGDGGHFASELKTLSSSSTAHHYYLADGFDTSKIQKQFAFPTVFNDNVTSPPTVLILSYSMSEDQLLTDLFKDWADTIFIDEPLRVMLTSLYGVTPDTFNPSNIFYPFRTLRNLTTEENNLTDSILSSVLNCQMYRLIDEFFMSPQWHSGRNSRSLSEYIECLARSKAYLVSCYRHLDTICSEYILPNTTVTKYCHEQISYVRSLARNPAYTRIGALQEFIKYHKCLIGKHQYLKPCIGHLYEACSSTTARIVNSHTVTMDQTLRLKQSITNLKVIHFIRDPRLVVFSRIQHPDTLHWSSDPVYLADIFDGTPQMLQLEGEVLNETLGAEVGFYCQQLERDLLTATRLQRLYPGMILPVVYGQLLQNPQRVIHDVISFLYGHNTTVQKDKFTSISKYTKLLEETEQQRLANDTKLIHKIQQFGLNTIFLSRCSRVYELLDKYTVWQTPG